MKFSELKRIIVEEIEAAVEEVLKVEDLQEEECVEDSEKKESE